MSEQKIMDDAIQSINSECPLLIMGYHGGYIWDNMNENHSTSIGSNAKNNQIKKIRTRF